MEEVTSEHSAATPQGRGPAQTQTEHPRPHTPVVSTFPRDPSGAREVAPPEESDETNEMAPGAGHDDPHPATEEE